MGPLGTAPGCKFRALGCRVRVLGVGCDDKKIATSPITDWMSTLTWVKRASR